MSLIVESPFWALFPEAMVGAIVAHGIDNRASVEASAQLLTRQADETAAAVNDVSEIASHPAVAPWRAAYQRFGVKPSKVRSSIESLLRSANAGRLRSINPLVDLYNVVSVRHGLPCGGEDLAAIVGELRLTRAIGDEPFTPLGGTDNEPPPPGAVIYRDDIGVVCSCWNWRESDRTKLTDATTDAVLVIEALPPSTQVDLQAACDELAALVVAHLGGSAAIEIVTGA